MRHLREPRTLPERERELQRLRASRARPAASGIATSVSSVGSASVRASATRPSSSAVVGGGDPVGVERPPGPGHERRRRSLEHLAADQRRDGDDRARARRAARPAARHGQDRPDRDHRVRRPDDDRPGAAQRGEHLGRRRGRLRAARTRRPRPARARPSRIMYAWKSCQAPPARTRVRTGSSLAGSTRARHAVGAAQRVGAVRQPLARREPPRPRQAHREVAVAEVEPDVLAERRAAPPSRRTCRRASPSRARRSRRRARR